MQKQQLGEIDKRPLADGEIVTIIDPFVNGGRKTLAKIRLVDPLPVSFWIAGNEPDHED